MEEVHPTARLPSLCTVAMSSARVAHLVFGEFVKLYDEDGRQSFGGQAGELSDLVRRPRDERVEHLLPVWGGRVEAVLRKGPTRSSRKARPVALASTSVEMARGISASFLTQNMTLTWSSAQLNSVKV